MVGGRTLLAEAIWRRLTTPRGTLSGSSEASAYGLDLAAYVGAVGERIAEAALPSIVEAELLKDDRIAAVSATATAHRADDGTARIELQLVVQPASDLARFPLTLGVTSAGVELIGGMP
jgi:hypothetical protein